MHFGDMGIVYVDQSIKPMFLDYQSLTVLMLVNTFGLLLLVEVKYISPWNCPCSRTRGYRPPSYVGNTYLLL